MDKRWTLAIDFGTTFTSAAVGADGRVDLIEVDGVARLPSAVLWSDDGFAVGVAADAQRGAQPDRLERTPKRHLGVREHMILGGTPVSVVDGVAAVLRVVYEEALRRRDGNAPALVCLTHPARWGEARIGALADAAAKAGIEDPTFLAEPIAAALRYADVNIGSGDHVAVYDLGGGTFDTAVLRRTDDGFMLVGPPGGDERLGGEDFDHRLADHLRAQIAVADPEAALLLATSPERIWRVAATELLTQARLAKEALSSQASYTVYLAAPIDRELRVTRPEFEALVRNDLLRTVDELGLAVQRAGLQRDELAAIYLTGGSSRIPLVTNLVHEAFAQVPNTWEDPKCVGALGAIRADA
ncbi:MAG: Hsp70 family protein, partial [Actinomycetota bacterium]|nr:Hsp70 family protein [Actinomycetota bacterium]